MSPYKQAIKDIKEELASESRCFISFRKELNPIMRDIVKNAIKNRKL